jgi:Raf kinase inhibitor-like YbhB/YbcL family protein
LLVTAAACGHGATVKHTVQAPPMSVRSSPGIQLTSSAFSDGGAIPRQYTCDGANRSPPLAWAAVPPGTASLALQVLDIDTPQKFVHWLVYDIKPTTTSLATGELPPGATVAKNSFGKAGYGGPCPPQGGGKHQYVFTLLALETELTVSSDVSPADLWSTLERSAVVGTGKLLGTYQRGG